MALQNCNQMIVGKNRVSFLVARSDSSNTDFNERALELRNCRKRRCVSRESSGVSRPFSSLRDRRGFPSSSTRFARSPAFSTYESSVRNAWSVKWRMNWEGELINWFIDWLIARLYTDIELEESTLDVQKLRYNDEWCHCTNMNGTERRLVRFLFTMTKTDFGT